MEATTVEPPRNYLSRALWDQHNVILMSGAVLFAFSLASVMPLLLGVFVEMLWLALMPNLHLFRSWADKRDLAMEQEQAELELRRSPALDDATITARFAALTRAADEIRELAARLDVTPWDSAPTARGLNELRKRFLKFAVADQQVARSIAEIPATQIASELVQLQRTFSDTRDLELRMGIRNQMVVLQRRLQQQEQLGLQQRVLESKLDMLQKSLGYLKAIAINSANVGDLANEIQALLVEVGKVPAYDAAAPDSAMASTGGWTPSSRR